MLIYSADARRAVAVNGTVMAPGRGTIDHFRSLGVTMIPAQGLRATGVPAALGEDLRASTVNFCAYANLLIVS